jgi:phospholipid/cholesterol/gamma-HCH transport system ATP-binding protein
MFTNDNKAVLKERVDFVLERVALTDAHNKLPSQISGGMQNVLSLALLINICFVMNLIPA